MPNVCIVDPDISKLFYIKDSLCNTEYTIVAFHHDVFIDAVSKDIDIAIISISQDGENGIHIAKYLKKINPTIKIILTSTLDLCNYEDKILDYCNILVMGTISKSELLCLLKTF